MAGSVLGNSSARMSGATTTISWSHTVQAGTDLLVVFAAYYPNIADRAVSGITYNGAALTDASLRVTNGTGVGVEVWYLASPATGANTLVVTFDATMDSADAVAFAINCDGVETVSPVRDSANATGSAATWNLGSGTTTADDLCVGAAASYGQSSFTADTGTEMDEEADGSGLTTDSASAYNVSTGATTNIDWTMGGSNPYAALNVCIKVASGAPSSIVVLRRRRGGA